MFDILFVIVCDKCITESIKSILFNFYDENENDLFVKEKRLCTYTIFISWE